MGRIYTDEPGDPLNSGHHEVLSVGLEALASDPIGFARKDPEHFNLILSFIQPGAQAARVNAARAQALQMRLPGIVDIGGQ